MSYDNEEVLEEEELDPLDDEDINNDFKFDEDTDEDPDDSFH